MPLHDVGYRSWSGRLQPPGTAALVIATTGILLALKGRWVRRLLLLAWSPAMVFAFGFFAFEQALDEGRFADARADLQPGQVPAVRVRAAISAVGAVLGGTLRGAAPAEGETIDLAAARRQVWTRLLMAFMRSPQAVLLTIVLGLVAPPLISRDVRAKAWLVYFTRPVGVWDYILGKLAVLGVLVALITLLPALALWTMAVAVSPSLDVALATWDLPVRIVAASLALAAPTVLLALACSSLTSESRFAAFAWFAIWVACWIAHSALAGADLIAAAGVEPGAARQGPGWLARAAGLDGGIDRWAWLSLHHALGVVQAWIFGIERRAAAVVPPLVTMAAVVVGSLVVLARRVTAPARR